MSEPVDLSPLAAYVRFVNRPRGLRDDTRTTPLGAQADASQAHHHSLTSWRQRPGSRAGPVAFLLAPLLLALGLATLAVTAPLRRRGTGISRAAGAAMLLLAGAIPVAAGAATVGGIAVAEAHGVRVPGARHLHALTRYVPIPGRPPRPLYVAVPETADLSFDVLSAGEDTMPAAARSDTAPSAPPPAPTVAPPPPGARLDGIRHQWQTFNNCGPATVTMALSYFGRTETQAQAAAFLKPNRNDRNVSPHELVAYAESLGLRGTWRAGGDLDRLKLLLAHGIPVIVEIWYAPELNDWMGHYRLLVGYDDATRRVTFYDSYQAPGRNLVQTYEQFESEWRVFNRTYVAVYSPDSAPAVEGILGEDRNDQIMYERARSAAQEEVAARPQDAFAWFNLGSSLMGLGRAGEAARAFDRARALKLPFRMLWYQFGPFEAYLAEGRYIDVLTLTSANLQQAPEMEESHYYRGLALQAQGQTAAARAAYQAALRANPRFAPGHHALSTLN